MTTGSVIRLLRTAEGKSQTDFAGEVGITRAYLSQVENNRRQPSLAFLRIVSDRLQIPLALLVVNEDEGRGTREVLRELRAILADVLSARLAARSPERSQEDGGEPKA